MYKIALSGDIHQQNFSFRSIRLFKSKKKKTLEIRNTQQNNYFKAINRSIFWVKPKNICVYSILNVYYAFSCMETCKINDRSESITV